MTITTTDRETAAPAVRPARADLVSFAAADRSAPEVPVLHLVDPMLGFPELRSFALTQVDDEGLLCALRSIEEPGLRFLVVPPAPFFPSYAPEIGDDLAARLGTDDPADVIALVLVTTGDRPEHATANLLAPIVVNHRTRLAAQVVQSEDLPVRAPLWGAAATD